MSQIVERNAQLCNALFDQSEVKAIEAGEAERARKRRAVADRHRDAQRARESGRQALAASVSLGSVVGRSEGRQAGGGAAEKGNGQTEAERPSVRLEATKVISLEGGVARTVSVDAGNRLALVGDSRGTATWLRLPSLARVASTACSPLALSSLTPSPSHAIFAVADVAGQLGVWDAEARVSLWKTTAHRGAINDICWAPTAEGSTGASVFATCGADGDVAIWDVRTGAAVTRWRRLSARHGGIGALLATPTEPHLIAGAADGSLVALSLRQPQPLGTRIVHRSGVRCLARAPHDYSIVSGGADGVRKFGMPNLAYAGKYPGHRHGLVTGVAVASDGHLVVGLGEGAVRVHQYRGGDLLWEERISPAPGSIAAEAGITCLALDRTETRILAGVGDRTIRCWRLEEQHGQAAA